MKKRPIPVQVIVAALCAIVAVYFVYKMNKDTQAKLAQLSQENADLRAKNNLPPPPPAEAPVEATKKIVVAAVPIPAGKELKDSDFKIADVPQSVYPNVVNNVNDILFEPDPDKPGSTRLSHNLAFHAIAVNDPIGRDNFDFGKRRARLEELIHVGMRVLSLPNVVDLSGGTVEDGSTVDLLFTYTEPGAGERTTLVAQDLRVLLNGNQGDPLRQDPALQGFDPNRNPNGILRGSGVIFEVTPDQAQLLAQLARSGTYSMILRNPKDSFTISARGVSREDIITNPKVVQSRSLKSLQQALEQQKAYEQSNKEKTNEPATP